MSKKRNIEHLLNKAFTDPASPLAFVGDKPFAEGVYKRYCDRERIPNNALPQNENGNVVTQPM